MKFQPQLKPATLIKRYKRFLADVILADGSEQTLHVANTGAMTGCAEPNSTIWYSTSTNPKRKYPHSWELTQNNNKEWICVNTIRANQLVEEAIQHNIITELSGYQSVKREVKYGEENSKVDFLLSAGNLADAYVEVKSVTLLQNNQGYFPDTVSVRGQKHLRELMAIKQSGFRAVLLFVVMHTGIKSVKAAAHIDPAYSALLQQAIKHDVEVLCYHSQISPQQIKIRSNIANTLV